MKRNQKALALICTCLLIDPSFAFGVKSKSTSFPWFVTRDELDAEVAKLQNQINGLKEIIRQNKNENDESFKQLHSQVNNLDIKISRIKDGIDIEVKKLQEQIDTLAKSLSHHRIGEFHQGGIIFWLDPTKDYKHGLIIDIADQNNLYVWDSSSGPDNSTVTGAIGNGAYAGKANTAKIISVLSSKAEAAFACINSLSGGYKDWYLPSALELKEAFIHHMDIDLIAKANNGNVFVRDSRFYWSSVEDQGTSSPDFAYGVNIDGMMGIGNKYDKKRVRCIRSF